jgi:hypothetical protein
MKRSDLKEMIRRVIKEKKLTTAEKNKKEDIVKGMKKSFKGDKSSMYAIATAKAKKLAESQQIPTDWQFTDEQFDLLKKFGVKSSVNGRELYIPTSLYDDLSKRSDNSTFKQEFYSITEPGIAPIFLTSLKKAINTGNTVKIKDKTYYVLKGILTKSNNFNFPNPYRINKKLAENEDYDAIAQAEFGMNYDQLGPNEKEWVRDEANNRLNENENPEIDINNLLFSVGSTLDKIDNTIDKGIKPSSQIVDGLQNAYNALVGVLGQINQERRDQLGPAAGFYSEGLGADIEVGHEDDEPGMLKNELARAAKMAAMLYKKVKAYGDTGEEVDFPQWWQAKIIKAKDYLQGAYDYLDGEESVAKIDATADALQMEEKDPIDVMVAEKKAKDLTGDGKINSKDYLAARDIAIKKAKAKKANK